MTDQFPPPNIAQRLGVPEFDPNRPLSRLRIQNLNPGMPGDVNLVDIDAQQVARDPNFLKRIAAEAQANATEGGIAPDSGEVHFRKDYLELQEEFSLQGAQLAATFNREGRIYSFCIYSSPEAFDRDGALALMPRDGESIEKLIEHIGESDDNPFSKELIRKHGSFVALAQKGPIEGGLAKVAGGLMMAYSIHELIEYGAQVALFTVRIHPDNTAARILYESAGAFPIRGLTIVKDEAFIGDDGKHFDGHWHVYALDLRNPTGAEGVYNSKAFRSVRMIRETLMKEGKRFCFLDLDPKPNFAQRWPDCF